MQHLVCEHEINDSLFIDIGAEVLMVAAREAPATVIKTRGYGQDAVLLTCPCHDACIACL